MFVDKESLFLKSGDGGDGMTSFLRYKGVSNGGPDGGDGGKGGSIYFVGDRHKSSLIDFMYKRKFVAENGGKGEPNNCHGKNGEDVYIGVPLGTVVKDRETGRIICDIYYDGQKHMVLEGGNGGKGNVHFCTSRRRAPHFSQTGEKTEMRKVILELKTIADVGLIGFPNVGKSTFINKVAKRKTARAEDRPGVTRSKQWVPVDATLELLDTPGILWPKFDDTEVGKRLAFTGAIKDDVLDIEELACYLMDYLAAHYADVLRERYRIDVEEGDSGYELLEKAGRKRGFLMRGAQVDTERMARILLDEFRGGKLGRFTLETVEDCGK